MHRKSKCYRNDNEATSHPQLLYEKSGVSALGQLKHVWNILLSFTNSEVSDKN